MDEGGEVMDEGEEQFIVGAAFGAVIAVAIIMIGFAVYGGGVPATTDNCPAEYKTR